MQDLRIVGVQEDQDPVRLVLSDDSGAEYVLPVDAALRRAVSGRPSRSGGAPAPLSPREIQATLRAGATVDEVVASSGLPREHVLRYAGPVADERAFIASRARGTVVAAVSSADQHRLAFGDAPATLEAMVKVRLRAAGVELDSMEWDAWRGEDGLWTVVCDFDAGSSTAHAEGIGISPPAEWVYEPAGRSVRSVNKWAESLSALPASTTRSGRGTPRRRLAAVDEPFNVDDAGSAGPGPAPASSSEAGGQGADQEDLLDILRARRGQRLGTDEDGDDKLATLLTRDESGSAQQKPQLEAVDASAPEDEKAQEELPGLGREADSGPSEKKDDDAGLDAWGFSYEEGAEPEGGAAAGERSAQPEAEVDQEEPPPPKKSKRSASKRPSMPRWDDILFGSKD